MVQVKQWNKIARPPAAEGMFSDSYSFVQFVFFLVCQQCDASKEQTSSQRSRVKRRSSAQAEKGNLLPESKSH